jgi:pantoate--beta-alanine ligase
VDLTRSRAGLREACRVARSEGAGVGFVPTMGSLHAGHVSLLRRARGECGFVAMSIFVNPLQFGPSEDLASYPRDLDRDLKVAGAEGVDLVFAPRADEMYPAGRPEVTVDPGPLGRRLEGSARPRHFVGVCTVVAKLFGLAGPSRAYFGEKDAQQIAVIRRMVSDLDLPVEVVACPTVRDPDGLALSSRNSFLSPEERVAAACLYDGLRRAADLHAGGEREAAALAKVVAERVAMEPAARLEYAAVVDDATFQEVERLEGPGRALVAARLGATRLIDNLRLEP